MANNASSKLQSRDARKTKLKLAPNDRPKVYWLHPVTRGLTLGYRKCKGEGAWLVRVIKDKKQKVHSIGTADDSRDADGEHVLSWDQARDKAENFLQPAAPGAATKKASLLTVGDIFDAYQDDIEEDGASTRFVTTMRNHLERAAPVFLTTPVQLLTVKIFTDMRKAVRAKGGPGGKEMTEATYDRSIAKPMRAAMNLSASEYREVWDEGLELYGGEPEARNVILTTEEISKFVHHAYRHRQDIGLFVHMAQVTGNRPSQFERIKIDGFADVDSGSPGAPYVMMPRSRKGGAKKRQERVKRGNTKPFKLPITMALALQLRAAAKGRAGHEFLLLRRDGKAWAEVDRGSAFDNEIKKIVAAAGLTHPRWPVTLYALRHTSIVQQLLAGVPTIGVAKNHNTKVDQIEAHYAKYIQDVTLERTRAALVELAPIAA